MDLESSSVISKSFVCNLISRLRTMAKKPTIDSDIGTVFDQYLESLRETQIFLNNGIFTINFAEAALLLECGAFVYGKKVDLLWDETIKHQKRMLSYNCNKAECSSETARLEERLQKYRRKRRKVEEKRVEKLTDEDEVQQFIDSMAKINDNVEEDFLTLGNDENFSKTLDSASQNEMLKLSSFRSLESYNRQLFVPTRFPIYVNDEYLCCNTQLYADRWLFAASEYNSELQYREGCNVNFIGHNALDNLLQQYICEKNVKVADFDESVQKDFDEYVKSYVGTHSNIMYNFHDRCKKLCPRRSSILLARLPEDVLQNYLDKEENQTDDIQNELETSSDHDNQPMPNIKSIEETSVSISTLPRHMSTSSSDVDSGFNESAVDSLNGLSQNSTDDNSPTCHTNSDSNSFEQDDGTSLSLIASTVIGDTSIPIDTLKRTSTPNADTPDAKTPASKSDGTKTIKRKLEFVDDEAPKRKKKSVVFRWLKTTTTNLKKYEKFYRENYKMQDGEGNSEDLSDLEDDINSDIGLPEQNDPDEHKICTSLPHHTVTDSLESNRIDTCVPEQNGTDAALPEHNKTVTDSLECNNTPEEVNNNQMEDNNEVPCTVQKSINKTAPYMDSEALQIMTDRLKERQESQRKYLEWKYYIEGKIARSSKDSFDIHSYSAKVLSTLSKSRTMKFSDLVRNNSASEVVRYFVSTLDLVKDRNVEVSRNVPGYLANDTFEIKLLSMERHHEKLDEYQAPSKTTLEMNLARIQKRNFKKQKLDYNC